MFRCGGNADTGRTTIGSTYPIEKKMLYHTFQEGLPQSSALCAPFYFCCVRSTNHPLRDRPELADKPVAVGGESMISTTNYHARLKGVRSAMPGFIGRKLCPELVFVKPDYDK